MHNSVKGYALITVLIYFALVLVSCSPSTSSDEKIDDLQSMGEEGKKVSLTRDYCDWAFGLSESQRAEANNSLTELKAGLEDTRDTLTYDGYISQNLTHRGATLALNSKSLEDCRSNFDWAKKFVTDNYDKDLMVNDAEVSTELSPDFEIQNIQSKLRRHHVFDITGRNLFNKIYPVQDKSMAAKDWAAGLVGYRITETDIAASEYLAELLTRYDWIDRTTFGEKASRWAFLIAQHSDRDIPLQVLALERMEPYVQAGEVRRPDYAYLTDRVAIGQGHPQVYGSQTTGECKDGLLISEQIENPETVDERRATMELEPLNEYLSAISAFSCQTSEPPG